MGSSSLLVFLLAARAAMAINFPYESIQLQHSEIGNNSDIFFGNGTNPQKPSCKSFPGFEGWPSAERWSAFNASLGGALIKGIPPAAACYNGEFKDKARCTVAKSVANNALFAKEDPLVPFNPWQLHNPCPVPAANLTLPLSQCKIASYPAYVVAASTVRDVQLAVNFARNNHIRLTIKNTGHDFVGRGTGGGALQVWVHPFKAFEYLPSVKIAKYEGQAARVGAALEQHEVYANMGKANITLLAPGSSTVGAYGGFMQGGGFSYVTSKYGLMADQVLALEIVTADGKFVHADPETNADLFWAIRGGGPSNFGIVTSAIVKAYSPTTIARSNFSFQTGPVFGNSSTTVQVADNTTFWKGVDIYFSHNLRIQNAKGIMSNYISTAASSTFQPRRSFTLTSEITKPGVSISEMKALLAPLIKDLSDAGVPLANPEPRFWQTYAAFGTLPGGPNGGAGAGRFGSRLFPRSNFEDPESEEFRATMNGIRSFVEDGGYSFHSVDFTPTYETAGYPGSNSAVNPALRNAAMHATGFDTLSYGPEATDEQWKTSHARHDSFIQKWRDASPGSGAYMNEVDVEEPNFKDSLYGRNYDRLLKIKRERDPWGLFYAVMAVGSDEWFVEGTNGLPTQQGRLCRVDSA
ncbi:FAD/FMN-containing isoamyl alcohol oxidase-like protein MreA [Ophiobolus disseminans]|uniref:FAD/FMN-containing isoamyl alcohol oxidase-like protein MreA n=1 Tax=Ophiobolus disseminans TaxID=1469910 RepID=A0A6A6ZE38_9PLEO|nr:FAD/FMN-containing isoamyl alcohol oxidase-like protein MreA [Ophiobolus disseminans]